MSRSEIKSWAKRSLSATYWKSILVVVCLFATTYIVNYVMSFGMNYFSVIVTLTEDLNDEEMVTALIFVFAMICVGLVISLVGFLLKVFLANPLEVGFKRYFCVGLYRTDVKLSEMGFGFKYSYKNIVKTLCVRDIYLALFTINNIFWCMAGCGAILGYLYYIVEYGYLQLSETVQIALFVLVCIINGVLAIGSNILYLVKYYQYLLIPYILADNPDMPRKQVFDLSKQMMKGEKWHAFVLQNLSFIGWHILGFCTCYILHIFYILPYMQYSIAGFYKSVEKKYKIMNYGKGDSPII